MPATKPATTIRIKVPAEVIEIIDRIAAQELLSRTSWARRVISNAVKYSRWEAELNKDAREEWKRR